MHFVSDHTVPTGHVVCLPSERPHAAPRKPQPPSHLDTAYELIRLSGSGIAPAERSNAFDSWKDALAMAAATGEKSPVEFLQVLGAILAAVHRKDVTDFDNKALMAFREATNILRRPRLVEIDAALAMRLLRQAGIRMTIPLDPAGLGDDRVRTEAEKLRGDLAPVSVSAFSLVEFKGSYIQDLVLLRRKVADSLSLKESFHRVQATGGRKASRMLAMLFK
ncbi:MAG: hypothetical protein V2A73_03640 [Pseudomonadota bacterium]